MPLTVTFRDRADGTGAVATVAGSVAAVVTVSTARIAGDEWPAVDAWVLAGTRTGDGTLAVAGLTQGAYFGYGATPTTVSVPDVFGVTGDPLIAVATACRDAVRNRLGLVRLPGLRATHDETWLDGANKDYPCLVLSMDGLQEREEAGLDGLDLIGHPVRVSICDRCETRDRTKLRDRYEPWRQAISNAFRWQKIPGVSDLYNHTTVETLDIADPRNPSYQGFVSAMILWCWVYRTRGI